MEFRGPGSGPAGTGLGPAGQSDVYWECGAGTATRQALVRRTCSRRGKVAAAPADALVGSGGSEQPKSSKVDGTIELPQHVLTVGPTGRVKAQLSAKSVVVLGKVNGSSQASELVRIGETGSVEGAISAQRLVVADGARLQGRVDM